MIAIKPTTMVASASTVPKMSPIASDSSFFLTDFKENNSSGIVVPKPTINIPIRIGLIFKLYASAAASSTL